MDINYKRNLIFSFLKSVESLFEFELPNIQWLHAIAGSYYTDSLNTTIFHKQKSNDSNVTNKIAGPNNEFATQTIRFHSLCNISRKERILLVDISVDRVDDMSPPGLERERLRSNIIQ